MGKKKKIFMAAACLLLAVLVLWAAVFITDYICVSKAVPPVFAQRTFESGEPNYIGPGYSVEIQLYENTGAIEQIIMYSVFGTVLNAVILCY